MTDVQQQPDRHHRMQLDRCRVPHYTGDFTFEHSGSYYWRVNGPVPLAVAQQIYADPAANLIRVAGHCNCPAPADPWITWRMPDGSMCQSMRDKEEFDRMEQNLPSFEFDRSMYTFTDDRSKARGFIETYHIDSETGLRVFVDYLRWNGLL